MAQSSLMSQEKPRPTWEIAHLFPDQGEWSEEEYLALETNRLVEFSDGYMEFLSMPSQSHQFIVAYLYQALLLYISAANLGRVLFAPFRIQLWPGKYREPDIVFMLAEHDDRRGERYWQGADLVIEVISPDDRKRDEVIKKEEYAQAGIPEYWLVSPPKKQVTLFQLQEDGYHLFGQFGVGEQITSPLLPGLSVDVTAVFNAAQT